MKTGIVRFFRRQITNFLKKICLYIVIFVKLTAEKIHVSKLFEQLITWIPAINSKYYSTASVMGCVGSGAKYCSAM